MQWLIKGTKYIDHKDGNGLNNQKLNLRKCTILQNTQNRRKTDNKTSSIFKGVSKTKGRNKFSAYITINKKRKRLGQFVSEIEAAKAYDKEAKQAFGEFAKLNFEENNNENNYNFN